jgi:hypothetical protein
MDQPRGAGGRGPAVRRHEIQVALTCDACSRPLSEASNPLALLVRRPGTDKWDSVCRECQLRIFLASVPVLAAQLAGLADE